MPKLIVSALLRNEASKFLPSWLSSVSEFADKIIILDDNSTDDSHALYARSSKVRWEQRSEGVAWGAEASARAQQWELTMRCTEEGDAILILDADMLPARDPRDLLDSSADAIAFPLYDLWSEREFRSDYYWRGHEFPRIWLVRRPSDDFVAQWSERGIHCGHFPQNLPTARVLFAPRDYALLHYAYSDMALRNAKWDQYRAVASQLSDSEWQHAQSILDPSPNLKPLPMELRWTLRKSESATTARTDAPLSAAASRLRSRAST